PPTPAFAPPTANCAGNATSFDLSNNAGIIKTDWDFGDPASGALNQSTADPAFHLYSPAGNYPVTVTATNGYGCTASVTQVVDIIPNPFSGNITPSTSVICEGSSLTLNAPVGLGAIYVWNNGTILPTLSVSEEGVYDVTLTNANGCTYSPPGKAVDVNPAPIGTIKFLEINDFGQIVGVQYPQASVCAGEDVTLQIQDNGNYTYNWSGGNGNNEVLIFSEDRGNLLSVGTHTFTVTVTNTTTGCTSVLAPFTVTVNPLPENFSLSTNNVCAGLPSTISYFGPQPPEWQIVWNTGDVGPGIVTEEAGLYFVRVINEFGCSAQSNTVVIFPGPNVSALPSGCHERCNPDTLCLPSLPDIVSWQWFYEGNIIPGATSNQFAATQSGVYWATLVDVNGCEATSAPLTVALYNGFGNIVGQVWSDVNSNGVIDGLDTLVSGIPVQLLQNGVVVAPQQSDQNGGFNWSNVLSTSYTIQVDTLLISPLWEVVILTDSVQLTGCGGKVFAQLLVDGYNCPPIQSLVHLSACPGQSVSFHGTAVPAGSTQTFTLQNFQGCDSVITVSVSALPVSASTLNTSVCPGSTFTYNGVELAPGQTQDFPFTNWLGCDSIVTVSVSALPVSASTLNTSVCPGSTFTYNGVELAPGQTQDFPFTNWLGCDSIVTVSVSALPVSASTLNTSVCPGSTFTYNGVELAPGQTQDFSITNWLGCDSIVTVSVSALPVSSGAVSFGVCPNETYIFEGVVLPIGSTQNFTLKNVYGCDSVVTVTIFEKPSTTELLEVKVCPGESYTFQNQEIAPGEIKQFHWMNTEGCDSSLTISVTAWPVIDFDIEHKPSCPNLPTGSITVSDPLGLAVDFSINNTDFQTSPVFQSVEAGMYTIYVRDGHGCMVEKTTEVIQSPALEVTFP
ncbi:MAG: PKD domain-containing protein, partial [Saprospiraceae bacterium]|nr:PKD domain-containing protein [Saprospiraceae bacterium]